ncbi:putative cysteine desulfurase [Trifolium repens]|nr:putative cysteine desulfurase [Trifolium repens]
MRAALAFWVKEYINYEEIEKRDQLYINKALKRLMPNPNIEILGKSTKRQAILSFVIYSTTNITKILGGSFVATLLNDVFGESNGIYDLKPTNKDCSHMHYP